MILILYATHTGYTQEVAELLHGQLLIAFPHLQFELSSVRDADEEIIKNFNLIIFGASTWDDGLNQETKIFLDKIKTADFSNQQFGLFGLGDSQFLVFCAAQPIIEQQLKKQGAIVLSPVFTFNNYQTGQDIVPLLDWAKLLIHNQVPV